MEGEKDLASIMEWTEKLNPYVSLQLTPGPDVTDAVVKKVGDINLCLAGTSTCMYKEVNFAQF